MPPKIAVDKLLESTPQLWRGRQGSCSQRTLPTGHAKLDARLPGKGWPLGAMTELVSGNPGLGEFRLLFPALVDTGERGQWVILVDPPWIPYPASLQGHGLLLERLLLVRTRGGKESLWACEQALRNGRGGAVLAWPEHISFARLRRLQIAAESSAKAAFLFRPESALMESSPAALRLQLEPDDHHGTRINILKCRGSRPPEPVWIPLPGAGKQDSLYVAAGDSNNAVESSRLPAQPGAGKRDSLYVAAGDSNNAVESSRLPAQPGAGKRDSLYVAAGDSNNAVESSRLPAQPGAGKRDSLYVAAGDSNNAVESSRLPAQPGAGKRDSLYVILTENKINTTLAGNPLPAVAPGPPYPRSKQH